MKEDEKSKDQNRNLILLFFVIVPAITIGGYFLYLKLMASDEQISLIEDRSASQEQFVADAEPSATQVSGCVDSANKIAKSNDFNKMFEEYKNSVNGCRDIAITTDGSDDFRKEGIFQDLIVDIGLIAAKTDKPKATEILTFAKNMQPWEFYMGPISCDSKVVMDSYLESFNLLGSKECVKPENIKEKIQAELQKKNFQVLSKLINKDLLSWLSVPESEVGCPERLNDIQSVLAKVASGNIEVEQGKADSSEPNSKSFLIKNERQDKANLLFKIEDGCVVFDGVILIGAQK